MSAAHNPPRLTTCPDCGKTVSRRAESCRHCGCPFDVSEVLPVDEPNPQLASLQDERLEGAKRTVKCIHCGFDNDIGMFPPRSCQKCLKNLPKTDRKSHRRTFGLIASGAAIITILGRVVMEKAKEGILQQFVIGKVWLFAVMVGGWVYVILHLVRLVFMPREKMLEMSNYIGTKNTVLARFIILIGLAFFTMPIWITFLVWLFG